MNRRGAACLVVAVAACGWSPPPPASSPTSGEIARPSAGDASAAPDPMGPRPGVAPAKPYAPPSPVVYRTDQGLTVWLLERHALPIVGMRMVVPFGSASDPKGKSGVSYATANMLDEGAGERGALSLSDAVEMLGATLSTSATPDGSSVAMTVLKPNLATGFALFADVVARPRFDPSEWRRVRALWLNELRERASDPALVRHVVSRAVIYGLDHPYGHPVSGFSASASAITLDDLKRFYAAAFAPDRATLVVVGDVTQAELSPLIEANLATWKARAHAPPITTPEPPKPPSARVVLVDRPDAPQSVIAAVRVGVTATDPDAPIMERANIALGGSFTSRLNQDLREQHGWSYGAGSHSAVSRGVGQIVASAAVHTEHTGEALRALLDDVREFQKGLSPQEVDKTGSQARADAVQAFETVDKVARQFAGDAMLGLPPSHEAAWSLARDGADKAMLDAVASKHFEFAGGAIVVVGPKKEIEPQLRAIGFAEFELRDAEARLIRPARAPHASAAGSSP